MPKFTIGLIALMGIAFSSISMAKSNYRVAPSTQKLRNTKIPKADLCAQKLLNNVRTSDDYTEEQKSNTLLMMSKANAYLSECHSVEKDLEQIVYLLNELHFPTDLNSSEDIYTGETLKLKYKMSMTGSAMTLIRTLLRKSSPEEFMYKDTLNSLGIHTSDLQSVMRNLNDIDRKLQLEFVETVENRGVPKIVVQAVEQEFSKGYDPKGLYDPETKPSSTEEYAKIKASYMKAVCESKIGPVQEVNYSSNSVHRPTSKDACDYLKVYSIYSDPKYRGSVRRGGIQAMSWDLAYKKAKIDSGSK